MRRSAAALLARPHAPPAPPPTEGLEAVRATAAAAMRAVDDKLAAVRAAVLDGRVAQPAGPGPMRARTAGRGCVDPAPTPCCAAASPPQTRTPPSPPSPEETPTAPSSRPRPAAHGGWARRRGIAPAHRSCSRSPSPRSKALRRKRRRGSLPARTVASRGAEAETAAAEAATATVAKDPRPELPASTSLGGGGSCRRPSAGGGCAFRPQARTLLPARTTPAARALPCRIRVGGPTGRQMGQ